MLPLEEQYSDNGKLPALIDELETLTSINIDYYQSSTKQDEARNLMKESMSDLLQHLLSIRPHAQEIAITAAMFDFKPNLPGNGYHSMLTTLRKCLLKLLAIIRYIALHKESCLFGITNNQKNLDDYIVVLGQMRACLHYMITLKGFCRMGQFFPDPNYLSEDEYNSAINVMFEYEKLDPECFYGRCFGFQYCKSIVKILTVIHQAMVCKSLMHDKASHLSEYGLSLTGLGVYLSNPVERAKLISVVTRECDISFFQDFWALSENKAVLNLALMLTPRVSVDLVVNIPLKEFYTKSTLKHDDGTTPMKLIVPPNSDDYRNTQFFNGSTKRHISCRLISANRRVGQEALTFKITNMFRSLYETILKPSPYLIIHFHGGGFVGQSSASHEVYLRKWSVDTMAPIFSVDYSYAPQFKAPFQLEEAFFAYCWALENCKTLGSTGEHVCLVGDSAGGNLAIAVALMAIHRNVRVPDSLYPMYPSLLMEYRPGPSRMLAIMDPLIPMGVLSNCLQAYLGLNNGSDVTHDDDQIVHSFEATNQKTPTKKSTEILLNENTLQSTDNSTKTTTSQYQLQQRPLTSLTTASTYQHQHPTSMSTTSMTTTSTTTTTTTSTSQPIASSNYTSSNKYSHPKNSSGHKFIKNIHHRNDSGFFESKSFYDLRKQTGRRLRTILNSKDNKYNKDNNNIINHHNKLLSHERHGRENIKKCEFTIEETKYDGDDENEGVECVDNDKNNDVDDNDDDYNDNEMVHANVQMHSNDSNNEGDCTDSSSINSGASTSSINSSIESESSNSSFHGGIGSSNDCLSCPDNNNSSVSIFSNSSSGEEYLSVKSEITQYSELTENGTFLNKSVEIPKNNAILSINYPSGIPDDDDDDGDVNFSDNEVTSKHRMNNDSNSKLIKVKVNEEVAAYAKLKNFNVSPMERSFHSNPSNSMFISPVLAPDHLLAKLPKMHITACHMDPLLDDSVLFARKVRDLGVNIDLDLISDLPHGFLNFVNYSREAFVAGERCLENLKLLLQG